MAKGNSSSQLPFNLVVSQTLWTHRKLTFWTQKLVVRIDPFPFPRGIFQVPCWFSGVCPNWESQTLKKNGQHFHDSDNSPSISQGNMFNFHPFPTNPWDIFLFHPPKQVQEHSNKTSDRSCEVQLWNWSLHQPSPDVSMKPFLPRHRNRHILIWARMPMAGL